MTDLHSSRFYDLLPPNLQDAHTAALSYASDRQVMALLEYIPITFILSMVSNLDEIMCDQLALNYNIREYSMDMDIPTKREMIQFTFQISAKKGTRWAVNRLIETIFGFGETEEWFEYDGGKPFYFRVRSTNKLATPEDARRFRAAISDTKNVRSWLEDILILRTWHEVLIPHPWEEYRSSVTWGDLGDTHFWSSYTGSTWEDIATMNWQTVLGSRTWAKVCGEKTWGDTLQSTWGQVYNYVWEESFV